MPTGSYQTCHCGGAMRKLRGLQTLSVYRGRRGGEGRRASHNITPWKCFGKAEAFGWALVVPPSLTRRYMCAVIKLPAPCFNTEDSNWLSTHTSCIRRFCFVFWTVWQQSDWTPQKKATGSPCDLSIHQSVCDLPVNTLHWPFYF